MLLFTDLHKLCKCYHIKSTTARLETHSDFGRLENIYLTMALQEEADTPEMQMSKIAGSHSRTVGSLVVSIGCAWFCPTVQKHAHRGTVFTVHWRPVQWVQHRRLLMGPAPAPPQLCRGLSQAYLVDSDLPVKRTVPSF